MDDDEPQSIIHCKWDDPVDKKFKSFKIEWWSGAHKKGEDELTEKKFKISNLRSGTQYTIEVRVIKMDGTVTSPCICKPTTDSGSH